MPVYFDGYKHPSSNKMSWKLDQFCCGCSLRTGTKVIGSLFLLGGVSVLVYALVEISSFNFRGGDALPNQPHPKLPIVSVVMSVVAIVFSIPVLFTSNINPNPRLLVPLLVINILSSLTVIAFFLYLAIVKSMTSGVDDIVGNIIIAAGLISGAVWLYFWLIIYSFYHELGAMKEQPLLDQQT
ncbi:uncharacterized protein LOC130693680 [Daphnia carinata]|uniref:uncharacterized protein LOC130693680 n=1 Tax=Daphnia carinata TaxID=120202 RepID=UPI0028695855|nr:uncharacterized protein LOC130693680 [Daphnia carinata]